MGSRDRMASSACMLRLAPSERPRDLVGQAIGSGHPAEHEIERGKLRPVAHHCLELALTCVVAEAVDLRAQPLRLDARTGELVLPPRGWVESRGLTGDPGWPPEHE